MCCGRASKIPFGILVIDDGVAVTLEPPNIKDALTEAQLLECVDHSVDSSALTDLVGVSAKLRGDGAWHGTVGYRSLSCMSSRVSGAREIHRLGV